MKTPSKIQLARKLLNDYGYTSYTVVKRNKKPTSKGNKYEWKLFKRFTLWASGREKPLYYGKTSGSGGQATRTKDHRSPMIGDMMSLCPEADFLTQVLVFEFKDRLETNIFDLLKGRGSVFDWWAELKERAKKAGKEPALVFHGHGTSHDYIMLDSLLFNHVFRNWLGIKGMYGQYFVWNNAVILDLEFFFSCVNPWDFAYALIDEEKGKEVENGYATNKNKCKLGKDNSNSAIRTAEGRSKLRNRRARKRLG